MVDVLLAGNEAVLVGERDDVDGHGMAIETHASIPPTPTIAGSRSLPNEIRRGPAIEEKTIINNKRAGVQLVEDEFTAGKQIVRHQKNVPTRKKKNRQPQTRRNGFL